MLKKFKLLKKRNPWIDFIEDFSILKELNEMGLKIVERSYRCALCKGGKFLCGKTRCPILLRMHSQLQIKKLVNSLELEGSSPGIFIGRIGYPKVYVGPLVPPIKGNTLLLDTPEFWVGKKIEDIIDFRSQLVRGKYRTNIKNLEEKIVEHTREIALSKNPVDTEVEFKRIPSGRIILDDDVQPLGPSAPLKKLVISSIKTDKKIEKAFYDTDLKAVDAVNYLFRKKVLISRIQRAFSAGLLGVEKNRKLVPTRYSITAVDSIISKKLVEELKEFPLINEFRVYQYSALDNRWVILMTPSHWSYELIEAWYPKTVWNPYERIEIFSDWEGYEGRTTYPDIGGCWFAARLSVSKALVKEKRQASVVVFRETHPGYLCPVGVWNVRVHVEEALKRKPVKFNSLRDALAYISTKLEIPLNEWIKNSNLLRILLYQKKIPEFLSTSS